MKLQLRKYDFLWYSKGLDLFSGEPSLILYHQSQYQFSLMVMESTFLLSRIIQSVLYLTISNKNLRFHNSYVKLFFSMSYHLYLSILRTETISTSAYVCNISLPTASHPQRYFSLQTQIKWLHSLKSRHKTRINLRKTLRLVNWRQSFLKIFFKSTFVHILWHGEAALCSLCTVKNIKAVVSSRNVSIVPGSTGRDSYSSTSDWSKS